MFILRSTNQVVPIGDVIQGKRYVVVITSQDPVAATLEFQHCDDPNWYTYPGFTGTAAAVIYNVIHAFTPTLRISFATEPTTPCSISVIDESVASF